MEIRKNLSTTLMVTVYDSGVMVLEDLEEGETFELSRAEADALRALLNSRQEVRNG